MNAPDFDVAQGAVIDQARQLAATLRHDALAEGRRLLATIGYDALGEADRFDRLSEQLRQARVARSRAQRAYELESAEVRADADAAERWAAALQAAIDVALKRGPVEVAAAHAVIARYEADLGTQRDALFTLDHAVSALRDLPNPSVLHLDTAFIDEGAALAERMRTNQIQANDQATSRSEAAQIVHAAMAEIARAADHLEAARRFVEVRHGVTLPGFDYAILRAAAAPRRAPTADPEIGT